MKHSRFRPAVALGALLLALAGLGCSGSTSNANLESRCKCGTTEADVLGCTAPCAIEHKTCDNPKCTCVHDQVVPDRKEE
ncbi:MAG: hypothetical protein IT458_06295 [Planctomycetes bacterium]|nr:hypothetical protein [Planctomycetota bacterium]